MCTAALYITARKWRQPKCPLTVERIVKCTYIQRSSPAAKKKRSHEICREARKKKESAKTKTSNSRSLNYMQMQKCIRGGWKDCSVVKSFSCSSRGFGFRVQHQHQELKLPVTPALEDLKSVSGLLEPRHISGTDITHTNMSMHMGMHTNMHTQIDVNLKKQWKGLKYGDPAHCRKERKIILTPWTKVRDASEN